MKIKHIIGAVVAFLSLGMFACDDEVDSIGSGMRPDTDSIYLGVDSVAFTAKTVKMGDAINARSMYGLVGDYFDEKYGRVNAGFLAELFCPENTTFKDSAYSIESIKLEFRVSKDYFLGDSAKRIGLSVYEIDKPLQESHTTKIDPKDYCDLSKPLIQASYVFKDVDLIPIYDRDQNIVGWQNYKNFTLNGDTLIGRRFLDEWLNNPSTFKNNTNFKKFFPGFYISKTYGEDNLLPIQETMFNISYKYKSSYIVKDVNKKDSARRDTSYLTTLQLKVSNEALRYNHVENNIAPELLEPNSKIAQIMSPGGVCTELNIPLKQMINTIGWERMINSASFILTGDTEEEEKSKYRQSNYLLMIPKDSVETFFEDRRIENNLTIMLFARNAGVNQYAPTGAGLSPLITYYRTEFKDKKNELPDNLTYWIIPVDREVLYIGNNQITNAIYNSMLPTASVLRTDATNLKLKFIYTEHVNKKKESQ